MANILGVGINVPLISGPNGWFDQSRDTYSALKTDIKCLLKTIPGERIMQPNLGLNLLKYVFEHVHSNTQRNIIKNITDTISYWMPYISIKDIQVDIGADNKDKNEIDIKISFSIGNTDVIDFVTFKL